MRRNRLNIAVASANLIGVIAYVALASLSWVNQAECSLGLLGEPYVWAFGAARVLTFFVLLNLVWGVGMLARAQWRNAPLYACAWLVWIIAITIDFAHHC
jgi:hypothetical protein